MKGSKNENPNHTSSTSLNELVESVGLHASDSDKDTLAKLITFGDTWKAVGEKMEKAWWSDQKLGNSLDQKRDLFRQRCANFDQLMETRKEKEEETLKVLFSSEIMEGYLLDKYIEEYLYKGILYYPNEMDEKIVGASKVVKGYTKVLAYLHAGNIEPGVVVNLLNNDIGYEGAKKIAEAIKEVGLTSGVEINLCLNNIGDDGVKYLAEAIKIVGLAPGVEIDLGGNNIGPKGAKEIAEAIKEVGLVPGVVIDLYGNEIGLRGAQAIADAIKSVGLEPGVQINLGYNYIRDIGANYIIDAIEQKGLPVGATINLKDNYLSPEMKNQLSELNETVEGEILFE